MSYWWNIFQNFFQAPRTSRASLGKVSRSPSSNVTAQQTLSSHWHSIISSLSSLLSTMRANHVSLLIHSCFLVIFCYSSNTTGSWILRIIWQNISYFYFYPALISYVLNPGPSIPRPQALHPNFLVHQCTAIQQVSLRIVIGYWKGLFLLLQFYSWCQSFLGPMYSSHTSHICFYLYPRGEFCLCFSNWRTMSATAVFFEPRDTVYLINLKYTPCVSSL